MSDKIVIDLTENIANNGKELPFTGTYNLPSDLLPYPDATLNKVDVDFGVTFDYPDVIVRGVITCSISGNCDRCLKQVDTQIDLPFEQTFYRDEAEDEDQYVYTCSLLDATQAVCDEIVLSLPMSLLCNPDCKGLCPKCGCDLNVKQCGCDTTRENPFSVLKNLKF